MGYNMDDDDVLENPFDEQDDVSEEETNTSSTQTTEMTASSSDVSTQNMFDYDDDDDDDEDDDFDEDDDDPKSGVRRRGGGGDNKPIIIGLCAIAGILVIAILIWVISNAVKNRPAPEEKPKEVDTNVEISQGGNNLGTVIIPDRLQKKYLY